MYMHSTARQEPSGGNTATSGTPTDIVRTGTTIYDASFADQLIALNLADGTLRWKFASGASNQDCALPPAPVVLGKRLFYAGLGGVIYGLDSRSGKILWKRDLGQRATTKLSVIGNSLYVGNSTRRLFRIAADDGHLQSELKLPASPEGRIYADALALYLFLEDRDLQAGYLVSTDVSLSHINWARKRSGMVLRGAKILEWSFVGRELP